MALVRRRHDPQVEQQEAERRMREIENLASATALTSQDDWTPLTFENSFSDSGTGEQPGYYLDQMGRVWLRGIVSCPGSPTGKVVATLPDGWRPLALARFAAPQPGVNDVARIEVEIGGAIRFIHGPTATSFSLDGISYRVENEGDDPIGAGGGENGGGSGPAGALKHVQTIGDGVNTVFAIPHSLGSSDLVIQVFEVATNSQVFPNVYSFDANTAYVVCGNPPPTSSLRVIVVG